MMKLWLLLLLLVCTLPLAAQDNCNGRYETAVFPDVEFTGDIEYGSNTNFGGSTEKLLMDVYEPADDTLSARPLVLLIHGGVFQFGDKRSERLSVWGNELARRGYIAASINYRLGLDEDNLFTYLDAAIRAVQDAKAAVRFFRRYADQFRIDTSQIFALGTSAGAYTSLSLAYLDKSEVPFFIDIDKLGGLEGESGTPGYPSNIHGVVSMWGALLDTSWIQLGNPPLLGIHGTADTVVPYNVGVLGGLPQYGSVALAERAAHLGIRSELFLFNGAGHSLDDDAALLDSAFHISTRFLYSILDCNTQTTGATGASERTPLAIIPNPVNEHAVVRFTLPATQDVTVLLYDALGRQVAEVFNGSAVAGINTIPIGRGIMLPAGVYYCRLVMHEGVRTVPVMVR